MIKKRNDFPKMKKIVKDFIKINKEICYKCNMKFLCDRCYVHFAKDGRLRVNKLYCEMNKRSIKRMLERFVTLKEGRLI